MFGGAKSFKQSIGLWDLSQAQNGFELMFEMFTEDDLLRLDQDNQN